MNIFVSSTYTDLVQHRAVLLETLHRMGTDVNVIAMEYFGADFRNPVQLSQEKVSESDIYIGVLGWRYGLVDQMTRMSVTEIEYRTALARGIPTLIYLLSDSVAVLPQTVDTGRTAQKIRKLRKEISGRHTVQKFTTPEDLARRVATDLVGMISRVSKISSKPVTIDGPVKPEINPAHPFLLCHSAQRSPIPDLFDVKIYLDIYEENLNKRRKILSGIDRVVYQLHESFAVPVVPMQNWREHFQLDLRVYGEFWFQATVFFRDKNHRAITLQRFLNIWVPETVK